MASTALLVITGGLLENCREVDLSCFSFAARDVLSDLERFLTSVLGAHTSHEIKNSEPCSDSQPGHLTWKYVETQQFLIKPV